MASFDSELDTLFKTSAGASKVAIRPAPTTIPIPSIPPPNSSSKRKHEKNVSFSDQSNAKRPRADTLKVDKKEKKSKKQALVVSSDEENDPAIEDSYRQPPSPAPKSKSNPSKKTSPKDAEPESESDLDAPLPVHESLPPQSEKPVRKGKFIPEGETPEQKDARTIFIGNLPASAANNAARKALQKHVLAHLQLAHPDSPKPKIESSRFRSVAFKTPTTRLPSDALSTSKSGGPAKPATSDHTRARAAEWRAAQDPDGASSHKTFQTPAQKKKTAFITGALHDSTSSSASAYVVFAYHAPVEGGEPAWDPVEVAARAARACNGTVFMERTLRVDRVRPKGGVEGAVVEEKADPRTMIFVGNLDFEVHDDALRELFEKLVQKERGPVGKAIEAEEASEGGEEQEEQDSDEEGSEEVHNEEKEEGDSESGPADSSKSTKPTPPSTSPYRWVKSVRIIRDKDTQLGKGFAYVQFYDRASADEILAMEPDTIKLAKRKLRIQRCKTLPGATISKPKLKERSVPAHQESNKNGRASRPHTGSTSRRPIIPRADPALGDRIRTLSKDERKTVKSTDADRVARRLAKKKARIVMERGARKAGNGKDNILGGRPGGPKGKGPKVVKGGKRERSDKAVMKKNVKK